MSQILRGRHWARVLQVALGRHESDLEGWLASHARVIKSDPHSVVALLSLDQRPCYLKYYRTKRAVHGLLQRLGRGRGIASFENALALRRAGLVVPEPLACLRTRQGLLLLTEAIPGARDLKALWLDGQEDSRLMSLLTTAGQTLAQWHVHRFTHGDCKWSNFLFAGERLYLVDLEGVGRGDAHSRGAQRDLARFVVNAEDMGLREEHFRAFLHSYASTAGVDVADLPRRIVPRVQALRRRHLAKYGERGQRLL